MLQTIKPRKINTLQNAGEYLVVVVAATGDRFLGFGGGKRGENDVYQLSFLMLQLLQNKIKDGKKHASTGFWFVTCSAKPAELVTNLLQPVTTCYKHCYKIVTTLKYY